VTREGELSVGGRAWSATAANALEPSPDAAAQIGEEVSNFVTGFLASREDARVTSPARGEEGRLVGAAFPPERGSGFADALESFRSAAGVGLDVTAPGFLAFVPGGSQYLSAVATLLASLVNPFVGQPHAAPEMVEIESSVLRWMCEEFGLPEQTSMGVFTSGGSLSALTMLIAVRETRLDGDTSRACLYASCDTHGSLAKAARAAGFSPDLVRLLPVTPERRLDTEALAEQVAADSRAGLTPLLVAANAGTTSTGAVDPLPAIARLARREGLWMHVDGCYGGMFHLTARGRRILHGIGAADSIAIDPHKGLFAPFGCGALLVRDGSNLRAAFGSQLDDPYLQDHPPAPEGLPDFSEHSLELSRPFRGLAVWLPLQAHGVGAFRAALDEKLDLAASLARGLKSIPGIEAACPVDLSVVTFRPSLTGGLTAEQADDLGRRLLERVNASGRVYLSHTVIEGRYALRACVLNHRTHGRQIDEALRLIAEHAAALGLGTATAAGRRFTRAPVDGGRQQRPVCPTP
jgi:aromatic-L-amino-acid/L-tryptophan decarboxylase